MVGIRRSKIVKWITAFDLNQWAARTTARLTFPALIADLIRASADDVNAFRFPNGEMGQIPGLDGDLDVDNAIPPYVPAGRSVWEFGTNADAIAKVDGDYNKRTGQFSPEKRAEMAFVFVTPRSWKNGLEKIGDWVDEKIALTEWKDVRLIDGAQLEHWLEMHPSVAAHWARKELLITPNLGARSTSEFWQQFSSRFDPPLTEDVVLCARQPQAEKLVNALLRGESKVFLAADSSDEVIAFAVAAIRRADAAKRSYLEARTIVVDTAEAATQLAVKKGLIFLPRGSARNEVGVLATNGPTVVSAGADEPRGKFDILERPSTLAMGQALMTMGMGHDAAMDLARKCGRSIAVLARRIPSGSPGKPEWIGKIEALIPALLAGGWDTAHMSDKAVLQKLARNDSYDAIEKPLRSLRTLTDPPIDREDSVWKVRAPVDAFTYIGEHLGEDDLTALAEMATEVFGEIIEPPKPGDLFKQNSQRTQTHSTWLRDGLATTLLHIAVLSDLVDLKIPGKTPQRFVDEIVRELPGLHSDWRLMASLRDNLTYLAEAAPDSFLGALELLLEGDSTEVRTIFSEGDDFLSPTSPHVGVLWGLELLAWDPANLLRVSKVLARLASVDPGGKLQNRPVNSLRDIFLAWSPGTNATPKQRHAVLASIVRDFPGISWELVVKLLPGNSTHTSPGQKPLFREAGSSNVEELTYGVVWGSQNALVQLAIEQVGDDGTRLTTLIGQLNKVPLESFTAIVEAVTGFLNGKSGEDGYEVWKALKRELDRNQTYQDTDWALKSEGIGILDAVVKRFEPKDPLHLNTNLFDDWMPYINGARDGDDKAVEAARERAVSAVMSFGGVAAVVEFAQKVKIPHLMIPALEKVAMSLEDSKELVIQAIALGTPDLINLASFVSAWRLESDLLAWRQILIDTASEKGWPPRTLAQLLLNLPEGASSWTLVDSFGSEVAAAYWGQKHSFGLKGSSEDVKYALERYLAAGRAMAAMAAAHNRLGEVDTATLLRILEQAIPEINEARPENTTMTSYYVEAVFKTLDGRSDVTDEQIAAKEHAYLPLLDERTEPLKLHRLILQQPQLFVDIIKVAFKPASGEAPELSELDRRRGSSAYRLLSSIKIAPGQTGDDVDEGQATAWSLEVQKLVSEADRLRIGEQYMGHVLAHSPMDPVDGGWPHRAIRAVIEKVASADVETGVRIERQNMRGSFMKSVGEGGGQERAFAETTRQWAEIASGYPRTMAMLFDLAKSWEADAEREDVCAAKDKLRD